MSHIHHKEMAMFAEDAAETDEPQRLWQCRERGREKWIDFDCKWMPQWRPECEYRRKPRTLKIGTYDVPEPMREAPEKGKRYWVPSFDHICGGSKGIINANWNNGFVDRERLSKGVCFHRKEDAELCAKALLSLLEGE